MTFKQKFRSADVLIIDDIQFMIGKNSTQEEFFHTFNSLLDLNKRVIISADRSPSELSSFDDRMKSRLSGGLVVDIMPNAIVFPTMSGRVEISWPNLTKEGPSSFNALATLTPSESFISSLFLETPIDKS